MATANYRLAMTEEPLTPNTDDIGARARTAAGWQFLSKGINTALQMVTSIVLARLLMPADFGIIGMAGIVTGLAAVFQDLGFGQALVQRAELRPEHARSAFWMTLIMGGLLYAAMYLGAPLTGGYFHDERMVRVLRLVALSFLVSPFSVVPESLMRRELDFRRPFWAGLAGTIAAGAVGITMALLGYGYWSLVWALLASSIGGTVTLCAISGYSPPWVPSLRGGRDLFAFGAGATGVKLFGTIAEKLDYLVVGRRLSADALGLYERAFRLVAFPLGVPWLFCGIIFPAFAQLQGDPCRARQAFSRVLCVSTLLAWPIFVLLLVSAAELVPLIFGRQWMEAVAPCRVLILSGFLRVLIDVARSATKAMGNRYVWREGWCLAAYSLALGIGAWWGSRWGIVGVAWATTGATAALLILVLRLTRYAMGFGARDCVRSVAGPAAVTGLAGAGAWAVRSLLLLAQADPWWVLIGSSAAGAGAAAGAVFLIPSGGLLGIRSEIAATANRLRMGISGMGGPEVQ